MQIVRALDKLPPALRGGVVAIGNFDGVHRGHAQLVKRLVSLAEHLSGPALVFTFDPHPLAILKPEWVPTPMTRVDRKAELLGELGVDAVIAYPTDRALLSLDPSQFFELIVRDRLNARGLVEGPNFHFGKDRAGDVLVLRRLCDATAITLEVVDLIRDTTFEAESNTESVDVVSSSRVRALIQAGDVCRANDLLTKPYRLSGIVGHGAERGRTIGFPTANLEQIQTVLPALGVYAGRAWFGNQPHAAAINIGPNPTFGEAAVKIEVHLIDFDQNLYDRPLTVELLDRLRDIETFPSLTALQVQLKSDVAGAREIVEMTNGQ